MSSVIPKDLTGLVPYPTKMDAWIPGTSTQGDNLCMELPISEITECVLGKDTKPTIEVFVKLGLVHQIQIYNSVVRMIGYGKLLTHPYGYSEAELITEESLDTFINLLLEENGNDPVQLLKLLKVIYDEQSLLRTAFAMNQSMKEQGIMTEPTKVTDQLIETVNGKGEANQRLAELLEDKEILKEVEPIQHDVVLPRRRKKSKAKSNHLPNMRNAKVKRALGASILGLLGNVQRDTQDAQKRALLKAMPMTDVVELATGEPLPDYQANLLNGFHAKADPTAPVVERMGSYVTNANEWASQVPFVSTEKLSEELEGDYERLLDKALNDYLTDDLFPTGLGNVDINGIKANIRELFIKQHYSVTRDNILDKLQQNLANKSVSTEPLVVTITTPDLSDTVQLPIGSALQE